LCARVVENFSSDTSRDETTPEWSPNKDVSRCREGSGEDEDEEEEEEDVDSPSQQDYTHIQQHSPQPSPKRST